MLKSITLDNFRSHKYTKIEFTPGLNVIIGENGAGKSSIFQAIGIALFDNVHHLKELVQYGTDFASIDVLFTLDSHSYRSYRNFGSYSSWQVMKDGELMSDGRDACYTYLSQLFGLSEVMGLSTFFNELIGVGQFNMIAPFIQSPADRKAFFNRVLGTDEYDLIYQNLRVGESYGEKEIHQDELELVKLQAQMEQYHSAQFKQIELQEQIKGWKEQLTQLTEKQVQLTILLSFQISLKQAFKEKELEQNKLLFEESRLQGELSHQLKMLEWALDDLEDTRMDRMLLPDLEKEYQLYQIQVDYHEQQQAELIRNLTLKETLEQRANAVRSCDTCPVCEADIRDKRPQLLHVIEQELANLTIEPNGYKPQPPVNYEVIKSNAATFEVKAARFAKQENEITQTKKALVAIQRELGQLIMPAFDEDKYEQLQKEQTALKVKVATFETKIESAIQQLTAIARMPDPTPAITEVKGKLDAKQKNLETLGTIRQVYKRLGPIMARQLLARINLEIQGMFHDLLGDRYPVSVTIGEEYEIVANIDGNTVNFNNLSGGQQVLLALAIRVSLLKTVSQMGLMLIDEPMDSLTTLSKENVVNLLTNINLGQLIVITHEESFDADNIIQFELRNGVSKNV